MAVNYQKINTAVNRIGTYASENSQNCTSKQKKLNSEQ